MKGTKKTISAILKDVDKGGVLVIFTEIQQVGIQIIWQEKEDGQTYLMALRAQTVNEDPRPNLSADDTCLASEAEAYFHSNGIHWFTVLFSTQQLSQAIAYVLELRTTGVDEIDRAMAAIGYPMRSEASHE